MSISSQLTPIPLAQASAMLRAMAQAAGQNVEARVVGQAENGTTQVQIGRQTMNLQLPAPQPIGTTLILAVQQAEGQVRMALVSVRPPEAQPGTGAQAPTPQLSVPATSVQLSTAALSGQAAPPPPAGQAPAAGVAVATPATMPPSPVAVQNGAAPVAASVAPQTAAPLPRGAVPAVNAAPAPQNPVSSLPAAPVLARPAIPYAVAAPAAAANPATGMMGSATTALPPVAQSVATGMVGQHAAPPNVQAPPNAAAPVQAAPQVAAPASPQAALTQMVQQALPRQDSIIGLTTALANVVGRVALPEPVAKAVQQVLGQRLVLDDGGPDGAGLQKAIRNSGIFQEAMLAAGQGKAAGYDMKSALLGLHRQLGAWLGDQAPVEQVHTIPPPLRGLVPRARAANPQIADLPDEPQAAGKVLLERAEAALSRMRLHQHASLPEPAARHDSQWSLDLPVVLGGQQSLLHMQIHGEPESESEQREERGWQVRFAINLNEMGEVGAQISLRGNSTGILLWAERGEVAEWLNAGIAELREELELAGLAAGAIVVRAGTPAAQAGTATSGHIVDAVR